MHSDQFRRSTRIRQTVFQIALALICFSLLGMSLTFAQGTRGSIRGKVTDPQGAIIPGATVKLLNVARDQEVATVQTDNEGIYQFLEVEPSTYNIIINANGFGETRVADIRVEPNRNLQLENSLAISGQTAEVTVTAAQELLDRETPTLGTTVEGNRVVGLPLNGRNILNLALLQPGVTTNAAGTIRVNGARSVENNYQLDGSNNNEIAGGGLTGEPPRPDAVQEFRLLTSNFEAEFGRSSGGVVNVVTKSGTNDFHGNVRMFFRPTVLSAARFFDQNANQKPRPGTIDDFRRRYERKEFGGNIGGPIFLPRFGEGGPSLYNGKNRAFFFVDYEGRRQLIGSTQLLSNLPTAEEKQGIFTRPASSLLFDPATGAPFPIISTSGANVRQQIPQSRFSPIGQYYLGFLPTGDANGNSSVGADEVQNFDILTTRVDPWVTDRQNFAVTVSYFDRATLSPFPFAGTTNGANVPGFGSMDLRTTLNIAAHHTYTFSPTVINSFLGSYARNNQPSFAPQNTTTPAQIGFSANFVANAAFAGPPFLFLNDRGLRLGNTVQGPQARVAENFQIQDSLSWAKGDHRFKFGFDGTKYKQDQVFLFINQGAITYASSEGANSTGNDLADLMIGNSPGDLQFGSNGDRDFRQLGAAAFAQDTWRVTNQLTLSLGLRWEYVGPMTDLYNRVAYYRPTAAARGITSQLLTSGQLRTPEGIQIIVGAGNRAPVGLLYPGDPDPDLGGTVPAGGVNRDLNNFAPRFGFAYSLSTTEDGFLRRLMGDQATVIRGGFGVFYGAIIGDTALQQLTAPGFNGTNSFFEEVGGTLANPFGPDPFPLYGAPDILQPTVTSPFLSTAIVVGVSPVTRALSGVSPLSQISRAIDPHIRTPYTYQYNLTLERSFLKNYVVQASYVGNRGRKLYALEQVNPAYGTTFLPYPSFIPPAQRFAASTANINARRVNTDIGLGISSQVAAGNSWYNAMELNLTRRYANGLLFQAAYTWSKSISDTAGTDTNRGNLDLFDRRAGRGLSADDAPHRFVGSFIYDIPFGNHFSGIGKSALGGWSFGGIYTYESGKPFSVLNVTNITANGGGSVAGTGGTFADFGPEPFGLLDPRTNNLQAFNPLAFRNATVTDCGGVAVCARRGTSGVNQFRLNNGINNFDLIVTKRFRFSESRNLELRFEAFNALNHTQFGPNDTSTPQGGTAPTGVNLNPTSATFGRYTSARESRVIQLGARFSF
jgi:Carboxypeptidase regulatory-like domain